MNLLILGLICLGLSSSNAILVKWKELNGDCYLSSDSNCMKETLFQCLECNAEDVGCCDTESEVCCEEGSRRDEQVVNCNAFFCEGLEPANSWSDWEVTSECTTRCGAGVFLEKRFCYCGNTQDICNDCTANNNIERESTTSCNNSPCVAWSAPIKEECSLECGIGVIIRVATCTEQDPSTGVESVIDDSNCSGDRPTVTTTDVCEGEGTDCGSEPGFSEWVVESECNGTCGDVGFIHHVRTCNNPNDEAGLCDGPLERFVPCESQPCPEWLPWNSEECTVTCGSEVVLHNRQCIPIGSYCEIVGDDGVITYEKNQEESREKICGDNCPGEGWAPWEEITPCTKSCLNGTLTRRRLCGTTDLSLCDDKEEETEEGHPCNEGPCIVDGGWSNWKDWTSCSESCDAGEQRRTRTCDNPEPQGSGKNCMGGGEQTKQCLVALCPMDQIASSYGNWTEWSECSGSCGVGTRERRRTCTSPPNCEYDVEVDTENCESGCRLVNCPKEPSPFDCNFEDDTCSNWLIEENSAWIVHSGSTPSVGTGPEIDHTMECGHYLYFEASCPNPSTSPLSSFFSNPMTPSRDPQCLKFYLSMFTTAAYAKEMGVFTVYLFQNGVFSTLFNEVGVKTTNGRHWYQVQITIDPEDKDAEMQIVFAAAAVNGYRKSDIAIDDITLVDSICDGPVDGYWSNWSEWECDETCGEATKRRSKYCDSPEQLNRGSACLGDTNEDGVEEETGICEDMPPCPVNGTWGPWSNFTECTKSCTAEELGTEEITRECLGQVGTGLWCQEEEYEATGVMVNETYVRTCNNISCRVDGMWTEFEGDYTECYDANITATCGEDIYQYRYRTCTNPEPFGEGVACEGDDFQQMLCPPKPCPVDGEWGQWSAEFSTCSPTCGMGRYKTKTRTCDGRSNDTTPEGEYCQEFTSGVLGNGTYIANDTLMEPCANTICPVNGFWAEWDYDVVCTATCRDNVSSAIVYTNRTRECTNPEPVGTGELCELENPDVEGENYTGSIEFEEFTCNYKLCYGSEEVYSYWTEWVDDVEDPDYVCLENTCVGDGCYPTYCQTPIADRPPYQARNRTCVSADINLHPCPGADKMAILCNYTCPGNWSAWEDLVDSDCWTKERLMSDSNHYGNFTDTNVTCGGYKLHFRTCERDLDFESECVRDDMTLANTTELEYQTDMDALCDACPVDGNWGEWEDFCNTTCGLGIHYEERRCDNPEPAGGGYGCNDTGTGAINSTTPLYKNNSDPFCYNLHCLISEAQTAGEACDFSDLAACSNIAGAIAGPSNDNDPTPSSWHTTSSKADNSEVDGPTTDQVSSAGTFLTHDASINGNYGARSAEFTYNFTAFEDLLTGETKACLQFQWFWWTDRSLDNKMGEFKLFDASGDLWSAESHATREWQTEEIEINNDDNMFTFSAISQSVFGNRYIDNIRVYPMGCEKVDEIQTQLG